jgi:hypothetical protein
MTFLEALFEAVKLALHGHPGKAEEMLKAYFTGENSGGVHTNDGGGGGNTGNPPPH